MAVLVARFALKGKGSIMLRRIQGHAQRFGRRRDVRVMASSTLREDYKTLRLKPGATEKEVKKAYRHLALQFHPDVCKEDNCRVQFEKINEAYQNVVSSLGVEEDDDSSYVEVMAEEEWEEWMGWEGASGSTDYSNHVNIYV